MSDVYQLIAGPLPVDVVSVRGREAISELFAFDLHVAAPLDSPLFEAAVLGLPAQLTIGLPGSHARVVQGVVSRVRRVSTKLIVPPGSDGTGYGYRLRIVPQMWMLTRRINSRIFQDMTVPDIVTKVLGEHGVAFRSTLAGTYVTRGYCVQYHESDYRFVTRLLAEEGIFYYFDPPTSLLGGGAGAAVASAIGGVAAAAGLGGAVGLLGFTETVVLGDGPSAYEPVGAEPLLASASVAAGVGAAIPAGAVSVSASASLTPTPALVFRNTEGMAPSKDQVRDFEVERTVQPRAVLLRDYDFRRPLFDVAGKASVTDAMSLSVSLSQATSPGGGAGLAAGATASAGAAVIGAGATVGAAAGGALGSALGTTTGKAPSANDLAQVYVHHGDYEIPDFDAKRAAVALEQARRKAVGASGVGFWAQMSAGHVFSLEEHPTDALNRPYVLSQVEHHGHVPERSGSRYADRPAYDNHFACTFAEVSLRPKRPKPRGRQPMETATVVGPPGEEIYTDEYGRIKVQFHWDLQGRNDDHSSCWIRVSQAWAGAGWGFQFVPRVGMEVIVGYVGGDPDRPMVLGCVNNGTHPTSYTLPARKTKSTIRSQSSPGGGGWNEISFEDLTGQEDLLLHAQKDMTEQIGNDRAVTIRHDLVEDVANDKRLTVGGARRDTIAQEHHVAVGGDHALAVAGSERLSVGGTRTLDVKQDASTKVQGDQSLEVDGGRLVTVGGDARERILGDRLSYVYGAESRVVWRDASLTYSQDCGITVGQDLAVAVGSLATPGTARLEVQGDTTTSVNGASTITVAKTLVLQIGQKTKITIDDDDGVTIASSAFHLTADTIVATSSKGVLQLDDNVQLSAKVLTAFSTEGGILELTANAQLDGTMLKLNCQNSAQQAQSQQKQDQAQTLDTFSVTLFDRSGKAIDGAPYEVSCQGYLDNGTASGGVVQIPKFPDLEKAQIRWARLVSDRTAELPDPSQQLPTYEYEMDVYLAFDADDAENARRKLHNMGHHGTIDQAVASFQAANGVTSGPMKLDDIKGAVGSHHDSQQPLTYDTGES